MAVPQILARQSGPGRDSGLLVHSVPQLEFTPCHTPAGGLGQQPGSSTGKPFCVEGVSGQADQRWSPRLLSALQRKLHSFLIPATATTTEVGGRERAAGAVWAQPQPRLEVGAWDSPETSGPAGPWS